MTNLVQIKNQLAKQIGDDKETLAILLQTTFSGLTEMKAKQAMMEAMMRGFNFQDFLEKNIYAIPFGQGYSIVTSIDYARKIGMRSGVVGKSEPFFEEDKNGNIISCKVTIKKKVREYVGDYTSKIYFSEYNTGKNLWKFKPRTMIAKCFDKDTEVLTNNGFCKFSKITNEQILQATNKGLVKTKNKPFSLFWTGDIISMDKTDLDFAVTSNHEMVTNKGKIEASELFNKSKIRPQYYIPKTISFNKNNYKINNNELKLLGILIADGNINNNSNFRVSVSREYKIKFLNSLKYKSKRKNNCLGSKAVINNRIVKTLKNQTTYSFNYNNTFKKFITKNNKQINIDELLKLSQAQARLLIDTWLLFDGNSSSSGTKRIYSSRINHIKALQVLAVMAGYSIGREKERDDGKNYVVVLSETKLIPIIKSKKRNSIKKKKVKNKVVWCVTVPSGRIIVRRKNFSFLCGNCAEMHALRMACPEELAQAYIEEEYQKTKEITAELDISEYEKRIKETSNLEELKEAWVSIPAEAKIKLENLKNNLKKQYEDNKISKQGGVDDSKTRENNGNQTKKPDTKKGDKA